MIPKGLATIWLFVVHAFAVGAAVGEISVLRLAVGMLVKPMGDGSSLTMRHTRESLGCDHSRAMATGKDAIMIRFAWLAPSGAKGPRGRV